MVKRLNYFDGQFLRAADFSDEQTYQIGMRQKHNSLLHTWGIADGLWPSADKGATQVKVSPGFAIDILGREIQLDTEYPTEDLSALAGKSPFITIEWHEVDADITTEAGGAGVTRKELKPIIRVSADAPTRGEQLILGTVTLDSAGHVSTVDTTSSLRTIAGARGGDLSAVSLTLAGLNIAPNVQPQLSVTIPRQVDLQGSLQINGNLGVTGNVGIGTTSAGARLEIAGTTAAAGVLRLDGGDSWNGGGNVAQIAFGYNGTAQYPSFIATRHNAAAANNAILFYTGDGTANGVFPTNAVLGLAINSGSVGIGTANPATRLQLNPKIVDDAGRSLDGNALMVVHPTPTAATTLNDPRDVLYLGRQGTSGQAYGAMASYKLSRYENSGTGSRTRLDLALTHDGFNDAVAMTWLSSGNVGVGTVSPTASLHLKDPGSNRFTLRIQSAAGNTGNAWGGVAFSGEDANSKGAIIFQSLGTSYSRGNLILALNNAEDETSAGPANAVMTLTPSGRVGLGTAGPASTLDIGGNAANNVQAILTRGSDVNFQLYAANGAGNNPDNLQAVFGLRYAGAGDGATLSFRRGGGATDSSLAFNTNGQERLRINSAGSLVSPKWRVTQVMNQVQGSLPKSAPFACGGGTLMIIFSGSGRSQSVSTIGMDLQIDGNAVASARAWTNETESHKAFTTNILVQSNVAAGNHTITLVALPGTIVDINDYFSVTVLELPF